MFNLVKSIYRKEEILGKYEQFQANYILSILAHDKDLLDRCRSLVPYLYHIDPTHFVYLCYYTVPRKYYIPFIKSKKQKDIKKEEFIENLKKKFYWTEKETKEYEKVIDNLA